MFRAACVIGRARRLGRGGAAAHHILKVSVERLDQRVNKLEDGEFVLVIALHADDKEE